VKTGTSQWQVKLKANYKFSDGTAVTTQHVVEAMTQINKANSKNAQASVGAMTWTQLNSSWVKVESTTDTPAMDSVLAEWCFPVFLNSTLSATGGTIFTGPFAVKTFAKGHRFELVPNKYYDVAAMRDPITIRKYSSGQKVADALRSGQLHMGFHLPATSLAELRKQQGITVKSFNVGYHYMMWHNMRRSPLSNLTVRKAVDLALDRAQLTQTLLGGAATRSLFPAGTPWARADTQLNAQKTQAEQLLDQAGWTKDGSGKRTKNGVQLKLTLVAYPQRPGLQLMQPVIAQTLTNLGITVKSVLTDGSSWTQLDNIMASKDYDLLMWAQNTLPAGDPQWFLNAFFRSSGGNNHAGLNSSTVDTKLDALPSTTSHADRVTKALAAHNAILDEVPVSNLMTPAWHVGLKNRMSQYDPWGSDYYVIRADTKHDASKSRTCITETASDAIRASAGLWYCSVVGTLLALRPALTWA
jgi:peptide/nickel transport system substrate-binding protein